MRLWQYEASTRPEWACPRNSLHCGANERYQLQADIEQGKVLNAVIYEEETARDIKLIAGCELWDIVPPSQPERTLVLACPRMDGIRLWPLPLQQPWVED